MNEEEINELIEEYEDGRKWEFGFIHADVWALLQHVKRLENEIKELKEK